MVFENRISKRIRGGRISGKKEGVKNAAKYLDTKNRIAVARHKID